MTRSEFLRDFLPMAGLILSSAFAPRALALPQGGAAAQGSAKFNYSGPTLTINTSDRALLNWSSFNIGLGETTTFVQPSSSSLVWNRINDPNASQILGNLNANGYIVLQNASGFYIGGQAAIAAHGLLMTTAPIAPPDLSSSGPWNFNTLPPAASIVNYGQINLSQGGSLFLISHNIENHGSITAPGGNIGLYAGQQILVSERPDGRGLSAKVTLPQGSVDNSGSLVADAGSIAMRAQVVNQGGMVQANIAQNVNGVIELVAGDTLNVANGANISANGGTISLRGNTVNQNGTVRADSVNKINGTIELVANNALNLGANSVFSAKGDSGSAAASPGGFVVLKSGSSFSDSASSLIQLAGANGGQSGILDVLCSGIGGINSTLDNYFAFLLNPENITLSSGATDVSSTYPNFNLTDLSRYAHINLYAKEDIELQNAWSLNNPGATAGLSLTAGHNLTLDNGANVSAGLNWEVNLTAGTKLTSKADQKAGEDGIYLLGNAFIQTRNRNINLWAGNEVLVNSDVATAAKLSGIRTLAGGSINVTALYGDVNSGGNIAGFANYRATAPFYRVGTVASPFAGGISTAAGGDVTIDAGGDVVSYLPTGNAASVASDAGSGAFGSQPGNVTITAKGNVYGHYVVANGVGNISAGQDAGNADNNIALSLIKGSWDVSAGNNIYLQEVRNPNGVFNSVGGQNAAGYHFYDYDPASSVSLDAGNGVYLTGLGLPRTTDPAPPMIFPPSLEISSGAGGIVLQDSVILFPSAHGNLKIDTSGNLETSPNNPTERPLPALIMSDSSETHWVSSDTFGLGDHGTPLELNNPDAATIEVGGDMKNILVMASKQMHITITGDMIDCIFSGQNLHPEDVTSIKVGGQIYNASPYKFFPDPLAQSIPAIPAANLPPNSRSSWDSIFGLALDPATLTTLQIPANATPKQITDLLGKAALFSTRPNFFYDPKTKQIGFAGKMSDSIKNNLSAPLTVVRYGKDGLPIIEYSVNDKGEKVGHFVTDTISWGVAANVVQTLYDKSNGLFVGANGKLEPAAVDVGNTSSLGYQVGGPGTFNVHAHSISLGTSKGILTTGVGDLQGYNRYFNIAPHTPRGASLNVMVDENLDMPASTIATLGGGDINVKSTGGMLTLGSQALVRFQPEIIKAHGIGLGIYSSGIGDVEVTALKDINIDSSRIASYNGGSIHVESFEGDVNAGNGTAILTPIITYFVDPATGNKSEFGQSIYGSGILATTLSTPTRVPGSPTLPGDISVETPQGDIIASLGGILQTVQNGTLLPGPEINLVAGSSGHVGNVNLGDSGVIGGTVNVDATGDINGLIISRQDSKINAAGNFTGTVLAGGTANLAAGGQAVGTVIGIGGVNASASSSGGLTALGQNVSVNGGSSQSTLGTSASSTAASQAASQQANSDAKQQVLSDNTSSDDDEKKNNKRPLLTRRSRVTVILPKKI